MNASTYPRGGSELAGIDWMVIPGHPSPLTLRFPDDTLEQGVWTAHCGVHTATATIDGNRLTLSFPTELYELLVGRVWELRENGIPRARRKIQAAQANPSLGAGETPVALPGSTEVIVEFRGPAGPAGVAEAAAPLTLDDGELSLALGTGLAVVEGELVVDGAPGGGDVASVNGKTGVVVLDAADVGADPVGAAAAITVETLGAVAANDPRLGDPRTPLTHRHWLTDIAPSDAAPVGAVAAAEAFDAAGGAFEEIVVVGVGGGTFPRAAGVGLEILVLDGASAGVWTITAEGPCVPADPQAGPFDRAALLSGDVYVGVADPDLRFVLMTSLVDEGMVLPPLFSGSYEDLAGVPTPPEVLDSLWPGRTHPVATAGIEDRFGYLVPDPDGTTIDVDGVETPVWRTTETTFGRGPDLAYEEIGIRRGDGWIFGNQPFFTIEDMPGYGEPGFDPEAWEPWLAANANVGAFLLDQDANDIDGVYFYRPAVVNTPLFPSHRLYSSQMIVDARTSEVWQKVGFGMAQQIIPTMARTDHVRVFGTGTPLDGMTLTEALTTLYSGLG